MGCSASIPNATPSIAIVPHSALDKQPPLPPQQQRTTDYVRLGLTGLRLVLANVGPMIPFPGAGGVIQALGDLLGMVETSMDNDENVASLRDRAFDILQVVVENRAGFLAGECQSSAIGAILNKFGDTLLEIGAYVQEYSGRRRCVRVLQSGGDASQFLKLQAKLKDVIDDVTLSLAADVRATMHTILARLQAPPPPFVDASAQAREFVTRHGGIQAVMADGVKKDELVALMDPAQQMGVLLARQAVAILEDADGFQRVIKHPDMRAFWRKSFTGGRDEVSWDTFMDFFPDELVDASVDAAKVCAIQAVLSVPASRDLFHRHLIRGANAASVSVRDIRLAFSAGADIVDAVRQIVGVDGSLFRLPAPDAHYGGRDAEAEAVMAALRRVPVVCIVADGGLGKSSLATDVGARLWHSLAVPCGAIFVDMREARTAPAVHGRFLAALDGQAASGVQGVLGALRVLLAATPASTATRLLLVVDNAEDALQASDASQASAAFTDVLVQASALAGVRLVVTSRVALPTSTTMQPDLVEHVPLARMSLSASVNLVKTIGCTFNDDDAAEIAEMCDHVPLVLRMVASAITNGRIVLQEARRLTSNSTTGSTTVLRILLLSIPKQQQRSLAVLSVFPSTFDEASAAAVMAVEPYQARGELLVLQKHGMVCYDATAAMWCLHAAVKAEASKLDTDRPATEEAFALDVLAKLAALQVMYVESPKTGLLLAREHEANIAATFAWMAAAATGPLSHAVIEASLFLADWPSMCHSGLNLWRLPGFGLAMQRLVDGSPSSSTPRAVKALMCLALFLFASGDDVAAQAVYQLILDDSMVHPDSLEMADVLAGMCRGLDVLGRLSEAAPLYKKVLDIRERILGSDHLLTINTLCNWANMRPDPSPDEALRLALVCSTRVYGQDAMPTSIATFNLAAYMADMGDNMNAVPLLRSAVATRRRLNGDCHLDTARVIGRLAVCLMATSERAEARVLVLEALGTAILLSGDDDPMVAWCRSALPLCE